MLHHHGHSASCMNWSSAAWPDPYWGRWGCPRERFWDYYNVSTFIHERLGMDYVMLYMPLLGAGLALFIKSLYMRIRYGDPQDEAPPPEDGADTSEPELEEVG